MAIDRSEVSRALAKALAFKACGKDEEAQQWAARLIHLLECAEDILDTPWAALAMSEEQDGVNWR